jgi:toxin FitB
MKIVDSNLVIYSAQNNYRQLRPLLAMSDMFISVVTKVETLGYHKLLAEDRSYFETLLATKELMPVTEAIINKATELRQQKKMSLGDCLIAATALLNGLTLYTNNTKDFAHILDLKVINPLDM